MISDVNPIFVDDREGSHRLMGYSPIREVGQLCRLDSGDVAFVGNGPREPLLVGVEVKSMWDLISSISTGRLQGTQLPALVEAYPVRWLLHYGAYRPGQDGTLQVLRRGVWRRHRIGSRPVPYGYVEAFLFDVAATGTHIKRVWDEAEAAAWIGVLHRWWSKPWDAHKGLRKFDQSQAVMAIPEMDGNRHLIARIASQLPGIGYERAVAAANVFSTPIELACAPVQKWVTVPGVGKVLAGAAVRALRGE